MLTIKIVRKDGSGYISEVEGDVDMGEQEYSWHKPGDPHTIWTADEGSVYIMNENGTTIDTHCFGK
jgi:hypothetical protein